MLAAPPVSTLLSGGALGATIEPFSPGSCVAGRYRIVRHIADGGMGRVYAADDLLLGGRVALKAMFADPVRHPRSVERFRREIQLARLITHPNVCRVFDIALEEGVPLFTMELLDGETLAARLARDGRLSEEAALDIATQLAAALDTAHAASVVHRDFKCHNVMLVPGDDGGDRAVVTDFGLAIASTDPGAHDGSWVGTPAYMPPEQRDGGAPTPAADIYAFGVVLHEMVTGALPTAVDAPRPPPAWDAAIRRCLAADPQQRFATAGAAIAALSPRRSRRGRAAVAAVAIAAGVAAALAIGARSQPEAVGVAAADPVVAVVPSAGADPGSVALVERTIRELWHAGAVVPVPADDVADAVREVGSGPGDDLLARAPALSARLGADAVIVAAIGRDGAAELAIARRGKRVATRVRLDPGDDPAALAARAADRIHAALGLPARATGEAARAWTPATSTATAHYARALARRRALDPVAACRELEDAARADPAHPLIHLDRAACLDDAGRPALAARERAIADAGLARLPARDRALATAAIQIRAEKPAAAIAVLEPIARARPGDTEVSIRLAEALTAALRPQDAIAALAGQPRAGEPAVALARAIATLDPSGQAEAARAALELADRRGARRSAALARHVRGSALAGLSRYREARAELAVAHRELAALGDRDGAAASSVALATVEIAIGELAAADRHLTAASAWYRERGANGLLAWTLPPLAYVRVRQGDIAAARALYAEAEAAAAGAELSSVAAYAAVGVVEIELAAGDLDAAAVRLERAHQLAGAVVDPLLGWWQHVVAGEVALAARDTALARRECELAVDLADNARMVYSAALGEVCLAEIALAVADAPGAETMARAALARLGDSELPVARAHAMLARALAGQKRWPDARRAVDAALAGAGAAELETGVHASLAAAAIDAGTGDATTARARLDLLRRILDSRGLVRRARDVAAAGRPAAQRRNGSGSIP